MASPISPPSARDTDIRLTLPARPENVAVVRHVLGALAEALDLDRALVDDMRLAVTEACTNVVRHAYGGGGGHDRRGRAPERRAARGGRQPTRAAGWARAPTPPVPASACALIEALTDSFEVERTPHTPAAAW